MFHILIFLWTLAKLVIYIVIMELSLVSSLPMSLKYNKKSLMLIVIIIIIIIVVIATIIIICLY